MSDHYAVLSLPRTATAAEIRSRFHELARQWHPDRFRGDDKVAAEHRFQEITAAFNVLGRPKLRADHDRSLQTGGDQAGTVDPNAPTQAYVQRGIRAYREGRYAEAAESFRRASSESPSDARIWVYLARACAKQPSRGSMAMSAIDKACQLEPTNCQYLQLAGELFASGGLPLRAEKFYNQALRWGGPNAEIELAIGELEKLGE